MAGGSAIAIEPSLASRLLVAIVLPLILLAAVGAVLASQIDAMSNTEAWVDHTDLVISNLYEAQKLVSEQDTSLRGYLLTEDRDYLGPYRTADAHAVFEKLHALVADDPTQQARIDEGLRTYEGWLKSVDTIDEPGTSLAEYRSPARLAERKKLSDSMRALLGRALRVEQNLLHERALRAADAKRTAAWITVTLLAALFVILVVVLRVVIRQVSTTYRRAMESAALHEVALGELLEESQRQGEELQAQQEKLQAANEELRQQSETIQSVHAQLAERKQELESSNASLSMQRDALEHAQKALVAKAEDLERTSKYKSEFLANMSHELRTPLNSTLILAKILAENRGENLTEEQVHFATTIYSSSNDLLALINDILDLSRIEAGRTEVSLTKTNVRNVVEPVLRVCEPIAREKKLEFVAELQDPGASLETDIQRVQQILKNLFSNALKFTEKGGVCLEVRSNGDRFDFTVTDTGIGIPAHQQEVIFEAFRQADGTTNRKFGGTGLGLSISRDLARLLGGEITVQSHPGKGSSFTLMLPARPGAKIGLSHRPSTASPRFGQLRRSLSPPPMRRVEAPTFDDDRRHVDAGKRLLLIVEDDVAFAEIVSSAARELGFQFLVAHNAGEAVRLAIEFVPSAILLDVRLPDHSGLSVLERLKRSPVTRHVPIQVVSAEDHARLAMSFGAVGYLRKPTTRAELLATLQKLEARLDRKKRLLVVEDDAARRDAVTTLLAAEDVEIVAVATVAKALEQMASGAFDCLVTDLALADGSGEVLLERMASDERGDLPPVVVYTGRTLSAEEERSLSRFSNSIVIKGARSPERLLDEVTLFLHQAESELKPERKQLLRKARDRETVFEGRRILLAEDDVRNVFALSSVFETKGAELIIARNGREAVDSVTRTPDVDLVLMDIMMPEMDGLEATREIRRRGGRFSSLPIIALTAKAMGDDREKCLEAGANDYISKPLDVEMLLALSRVWMSRSP